MFQPLAVCIGLRYTRAKRRNHFISFISLVSMSGIALGITALITVLSVMNGFEQELRDRILSMTSHATIQGVEGPLADWQDIAATAREEGRVVGVAPFVRGETMLVHDQQVSGAMIRGILPELEPEVSEVGEHMQDGQLRDLRAGEYGIILGQELAWSLDVDVGQQITVVSPQANLSPAGLLPRLRRFTVTVIFSIGMYEYDRGVALVHLDDAARLFRLGDGVSGIRLRLEDLFEAPQVARKLAAGLPGPHRVTDWTHEHANFFRAVRTEKRVMFVILALIVAVAAFNIVSTLVMVVTDKQSDIAILRTLGVSPRFIMIVFIIQGLVIGIFGTVVGIIGGVALALNVETIVPALERLFNVQFLAAEVYYISDLPSRLNWNDVWRVAGVAFLLTLVATLYPAWRASRTQPAEALRYE
ncbi:MAG: lipoprotein-releasing ABC transporter permease subunit [Gammaproteobacteria bacterium]